MARMEILIINSIITLLCYFGALYIMDRMLPRKYAIWKIVIALGVIVIVSFWLNNISTI